MMASLTRHRELAALLLGLLCGGIGGCSNHSGKPFIAWQGSGEPAPMSVVESAPPPPPPAANASNAGVVPHKPFIAGPKLLASTIAPPGHPTILLQLHARTDSPVPLEDYAKQPTHNVGDFHLRPALSAAELRYRFGPPAQLADYSTPWFVYRLNTGYELWLRFAQPYNDTLVAADVVGPVEDGYTRNRVFSIHDAEQ
jgi:hypothetical protein